MNSYQEIKKRIVDNKSKFVLVGCFVLMFLVGFGTGNYVKYKIPAASTQTNYTTKAATQPFLAPSVVPKSSVVDKSAPSSTMSTSTPPKTSPVPPVDLSNCLIKGNITADGRKIYHVPGGQSYKRLIHPKQCFNTEAEAQAAGFTKAKR